MNPPHSCQPYSIYGLGLLENIVQILVMLLDYSMKRLLGAHSVLVDWPELCLFSIKVVNLVNILDINSRWSPVNLS